MKTTDRIWKGLLPVLVLGLAAGALLSFGCGDEKTVTEYVEVVNNAPVLGEIGAQAVNLGGPLTIVVTATDPDGDTLSYSALNLPPGATFDAAKQTFTWITMPGSTPAGTYEVTFIVSDGGKSDSETITITVTAIPAEGANYTGKYSTIAHNFLTGIDTCAYFIYNELGDELCDWNIPAPGCEGDIPPMYAVQSDGGLIIYMDWYGNILGFTGGTINNDGGFRVNAAATTDLGGPITLSFAVTGNASADKVEGRMEIDIDWAVDSCNWSFDFVGPGLDNSNATITISGFTPGKEGVNVYAFVEPWDSEPAAIGGGVIGADGSAEIQLRPVLPMGCFNVAVWLDIEGADGDIVDCWEDGEDFICGDDLCEWISSGSNVFCIDEEGGLENPVELVAGDFSEGECEP